MTCRRSRGSSFTNGLSKVKVDEKLGFINLAGEWVIPPQFNHAWPFYDELALANAEAEGKIKYGYMNKAGEWVVKAIYNGASFFYNGWATVVTDYKDRLSGKVGLINQSGRCVWEKKVKYALLIQRF